MWAMDAPELVLGITVVLLMSISTGCGLTMKAVKLQCDTAYGLFFGIMLHVIFVPGVAVMLINIMDFHDEEEASGYSDQAIGMLLAAACPVSTTALGVLEGLGADMDMAAVLVTISKAFGILFFPMSFWLWTMGTEMAVPMASLLISGAVAVIGMCTGMAVRQWLEEKAFKTALYTGLSGKLFLLALLVCLVANNPDIFSMTDIWIAVFLLNFLSLIVVSVLMKGIGFKLEEYMVLAGTGAMKNSILAVPISKNPTVLATLVIHCIFTNSFGFSFAAFWRLYFGKPIFGWAESKADAHTTLIPRCKPPPTGALIIEDPPKAMIDSQRADKGYRPSYGSLEKKPLSPSSRTQHTVQTSQQRVQTPLNLTSDCRPSMDRAGFTHACLNAGNGPNRVQEICAQLEAPSPRRALSGVKNDFKGRPLEELPPRQPAGVPDRVDILKDSVKTTTSTVVTGMVIPPDSVKQPYVRPTKEDSVGKMSRPPVVARLEIPSTFTRAAPDSAQCDSGRTVTPATQGAYSSHTTPGSGKPSPYWETMDAFARRKNDESPHHTVERKESPQKKYLNREPPQTPAAGSQYVRIQRRGGLTGEISQVKLDPDRTPHVYERRGDPGLHPFNNRKMRRNNYTPSVKSNPVPRGNTRLMKKRRGGRKGAPSVRTAPVRRKYRRR